MNERSRDTAGCKNGRASLDEALFKGESTLGGVTEGNEDEEGVWSEKTSVCY